MSARRAAVLALIGMVGGTYTQPLFRAPSPRSAPQAAPDAHTARGMGENPPQRPGGRTKNPARQPHGDGDKHKPPWQPADAKQLRPSEDGDRKQARSQVEGPPRRLLSAPARALADYSRRLTTTEAARTAIARSWGLRKAPLRPPAPPAVKPRLVTPPNLSEGSGLPPVVTRVPTRDRVVFLTIDDGGHQDGRLIRMMSELQVPFSAFLSDYVVRDYDYFRKLQSLGATMNNHTLHHRYLPALSYKGQRREICRQQKNLLRETGQRPRLFRPPYGSYDRDTLRAAASCGIRVVPLWSVEAFPDRMEFGDGGDRLSAGDIILTHFRGREEWDGDMPDVIRRVLRTATAQGFAVARLEDYL